MKKTLGPARSVWSIARMGFAVSMWMMAQSVPVAAQNYGSTGQSFSSFWGFASSGDRTLLLQQAQAIRAANQPPPSGPTTVVNNYTTTTTTTDNRQNYQDVGTGTVGNVDFQLNGDRIGQNTNTVGAMNTGTTNVDITGSGNTVDANNSADSSGCLDGSISSSVNEITPSATLQPLDFSLTEAVNSLNCIVR
jgi:hypothetical protein